MKLFLCSHFSSVGSLIKEEIENKKVAFIPTASLREGYTGYVGSARKLFKVNYQKLYLSPVIDLFNGEVVSYSLSRHPNFKQVTDMLEDAFQKLPDKVDELILHSDQGWQYQMKTYQKMLKAKGITQSMSRKATCLDNAVAENFFGLLKTELFYLEKFDSIEQLEKAIVEYIDYYNNRRIKLKLNGLSPVQYRTQTVTVA